MQQPEPDAEQLGTRLLAHLAEVLRMLGQPPPQTRRQAVRALRRNKRIRPGLTARPKLPR
jgi:tRNA C32,U32 (ribose-2'-O)-methylase TrmJ